MQPVQMHRSHQSAAMLFHDNIGYFVSVPVAATALANEQTAVASLVIDYLAFILYFHPACEETGGKL